VKYYHLVFRIRAVDHWVKFLKIPFKYIFILLSRFTNMYLGSKAASIAKGENNIN